MFAALSASVPVPDCVNPKAPDTTSLIVVVLLATKVVAPVITTVDGTVKAVPSKVRLPVPPNVIVKGAVPVVVSEFARVIAVPLSASVEPEAIVMVPVPNGLLVIAPPETVLLEPATSVPAETVVPPVKVLAPETAQVPAPFLVSEVTPVPLLAMVGEKLFAAVLVPVKINPRVKFAVP